MCRATSFWSRATPGTLPYGSRPAGLRDPRHTYGLWFIAGNVVRDSPRSTITKCSLGTFGGRDGPTDSGDDALIDHIAELTHDPETHFLSYAIYDKGPPLSVPPVFFNAVRNRAESLERKESTCRSTRLFPRWWIAAAATLAGKKSSSGQDTLRTKPATAGRSPGLRLRWRGRNACPTVRRRSQFVVKHSRRARLEGRLPALFLFRQWKARWCTDQSRRHVRGDLARALS